MRLLTRPLVSEIKENVKRGWYHERTHYTGWTTLRPEHCTFQPEQIFKNLEELDDSASIEEINKATGNTFGRYFSLRQCSECNNYTENVIELRDDGEYGCDHICKNCLEEGLRLMEGV